MPAAVVAVASFIGNAVAVVTTSATIGAAVANGIAALGFAQGVGAAISAWATVASVGSLFVKPKIGAAAGGSGAQVEFKADPYAGIPYLVGRTGTSGNIIHANTSGSYDKNAHLLFCTVLSLGPIQAFDGFTANTTDVTFAAETASSAPYVGAMDMRTQLGSQTPGAFPYPSVPGGTLPEWTSAHKLTGYAAAWWGLNYNVTVFPTGVPKPIWTLQGVLAYDPRLDSTYPGGSGAQRIDDESTWTWTENPWLHALTWVIGRKSNGKPTVGIQAPASMIDVAAFVDAANVADANGWTCGGVVYSTDSKWDVLVALAQAGGGVPMRLGAKISCLVNTPRVSLATLTGADVDGEPTLTTTQARRSRINRVIPRYRSEDHGWEMVAAEPVAVDSYATVDGGRRSKGLDFPLVQDVDQVAQLAAYAILDAREFGPLSFPLRPRWMGLQPGDTFVMDEAEFGLSAQKLLVVSRDRDPQTGARTLLCRSETDAKHAFCLGTSGVAPTTPGLPVINASALDAPGSGAWTLAGATLTNGQGQTPALVLTGACDNINATWTIARYRIGAGDWKYTPNWPRTATRLEITGLAPDQTYEVQTAYMTATAFSAWTSEGSATAGSSAVTGQGPWPTENTYTPTYYNDRTQLLDANGKLTSWLGLGGLNTAAGSGIALDHNPLSAGSPDPNTVYCSSFTLIAPNGYSRTFPAASAPGIPSGTIWGFFMHWVYETLGFVPIADIPDIIADNNYLFLGVQAVPNSGGGSYPAPPAPPAGNSGGGPRTGTEWQ